MVVGTSITYRWPIRSSSSSSSPSRPYPSSATTQSSGTAPSAATSRTSSAAICGLVRNGMPSGMWASARRRCAALPSYQDPWQVEPVVQQGDPRGGDADQEDADLAVVLLAQPAVVLPGHAGALGPLLGEGALVEHAHHADRRARRRGGQLIGEDALEFGLDIIVLPGGHGDELLEAGDLAVADAEGDRLDALAFGAAQEALEIGIGMILGLASCRRGGRIGRGTGRAGRPRRGTSSRVMEVSPDG